jgi:alpha/beta superfamily hydrolase
VGRESVDVRGNVELPAERTPLRLRTADGLSLLAELATPVGRAPVATIVCLHPLTTLGGSMDSHVYRKAANRLPELAGIAVLRVNLRGAESSHGRSEGEFGGGEEERHDVAAAVEAVRSQALPRPWLVGWSFGAEVVIRHGLEHAEVVGGILLSPPLQRCGDRDLDAWARDGRPLVAVVPEHDDYLPPASARPRFARIPQCTVVAVEGAKHLWLGERATRRALDEIVAAVAPAAHPLPTRWSPTEERA